MAPAVSDWGEINPGVVVLLLLLLLPPLPAAWLACKSICRIAGCWAGGGGLGDWCGDRAGVAGGAAAAATAAVGVVEGGRKSGMVLLLLLLLLGRQSSGRKW